LKPELGAVAARPVAWLVIVAARQMVQARMKRRSQRERIGDLQGPRRERIAQSEHDPVHELAIAAAIDH
jgi:hypothetical protein